MEDDQGNWAFIAVRDDSGNWIVERRAVTVGELSSEGLEVIDGLSDGDRLITAGISRLEAGMQIEVLESGEKD